MKDGKDKDERKHLLLMIHLPASNIAVTDSGLFIMIHHYSIKAYKVSI